MNTKEVQQLAEEAAQRLFDKREKTDGFCNPSYFEGVKDGYQAALSGKEQVASTLSSVEQYLQSRIKQLNEADEGFCNDRWADNIPLHQSLKKQIAREESNKVTFARQELETVLKVLTTPNPQVTDTEATKEREEDLVTSVRQDSSTSGDAPFSNNNSIKQKKSTK